MASGVGPPQRAGGNDPLQPGNNVATGGLPEEASADEALRGPRDPVDVAEIRRVVTGRAALYYRCQKIADGWRIITVLAAPSGITLRRTVLPAVPASSGLITSLTQPAGLLDQLASGRADRVAMVHQTVRLGSPAWAGLAAALLPPELAAALHPLASAEDPAVLLVVPDGPLSGVPFSGLRLPDGTALADHAAVVFMPNLLSFSAQDWEGAATHANPVVVTHFGPTSFRQAFETLRNNRAFRQANVTVRAASDRKSFLAALGVPPVPGIAVISHHGETASNPADRFIHLDGGGILSEQDARKIKWPQTVVLGSCWASDITVQAGQDPVGLPTACLLGGARAVLGGQSVVDNDLTSADILARVTLDAARGQHPALTLRRAVLAHLARNPADRDAPPAQWSNLIVWTSRPPASTTPETPAWKSWTTHATAREPGQDTFVIFDKALDGVQARKRKAEHRHLAVPASMALQRAFQQAERHSQHQGVTSLDLLAAILDTDNADWTSFAVAAELPALPPAAQASREISAGVTALAIDADHRARVARATADAINRGERLSAHLGDTLIAPAHVVYGFLSTPECDATQWMTTGPHSRADLITMLSDRVFGVDLPPSGVLPRVPAGRDHASPLRATRRGRYGPDPSHGLVAVIASARSENRYQVITTLDFAKALARRGDVAWRPLAAAGFRFTPPGHDPFQEHDQGAQEISLGNRQHANASPAFADAFETAAALAYHLGDPEITAAHVLYGILGEDDNDAARWLQAAPGSGTGPVAVLAEHAFGRPLPPSSQLASAPRPRELHSTAYWLLLVPLTGLWMISGWAMSKLGKFALFCLFLLILIVTMDLADINTAAPNPAQLAAERPAITATLRLAGSEHHQALPATLLGKLSDFYNQPVVLGLLNQARDAVFHWGSPGNLSQLYLFIVPTPPRHAATAAGWLSYRHASYRASVTCQGQLARVFCLVVSRLPGSVAPSGFSWLSEDIHNGQPGADDPQGALVYPASGRPGAVDKASIRILALSAGGVDIIGVHDQSGRPIRPGSPVILNGRSRQLPLLGILSEGRRGPWSVVFPVDPLLSNAAGAADRLGGAIPGAVAYAGIIVGNSSPSQTVPGPAFHSPGSGRRSSR